jgi:circadian clock protein KaiB
MKRATINTTARKSQEPVRKVAADKYCMRLYVTGTTPKSVRAIANVKRLCETYLKGRYQLEVIDIYQQPALAKGEQIIAAPTLIKRLPLPLRRFIGDMTNSERILLGLNLCPEGPGPQANGKAK